MQSNSGRLGARRPTFVDAVWDSVLEYGTPAANALTKRYAEEIEKAFPDGPYMLAGNCQGAIVALDIAREILYRGRKVQHWSLRRVPLRAVRQCAFRRAGSGLCGGPEQVQPHRETASRPKGSRRCCRPAAEGP